MEPRRQGRGIRMAAVWGAGLLGLLLGVPVRAGDATAGGSIDFNRQIRPILARNCFACHGADDAKRAAGLRLDRGADATAEREGGGRAIVPGDPDSSDLVFRVTEADETVRMPPPEAGEPLAEEDVALLTRWITEGANFAEHWAFVAPVDRPLPEVGDGAWPRDGLDRWIQARLEAEGLKPSDEADGHTLLRRASLDLRGLPPTPGEIERFLADREPGAYERAVDRFLDDPAYGERWARVWLDLARYADSAGYGSDPLRPDIWRYRDWVIEAYNRNMPYDRFTIEQLAGDLLPEAGVEQRIATAFHRNTMTNTEGGTDDEEFRVAAVKDRVNTTMQVWMGLTMGCAQCHSHKYDPISQVEYYRTFAVFNQSADNDQPDEGPTLPAPTVAIQAELDRHDARVAVLQARLDTAVSGQAAMPDAVRRALDTPAETRDAEQKKALAAHYGGIDPELAGVYAEVESLREARPAVPSVPVMVELAADRRRVSHLLNKGNFLDPGPVLEPGIPGAFHRAPEGGPPDRLALARWLVDPANPLTARVAVNRMWAQLFGVGIVETEEDFGTQGELPSHPELLDWLALRYVQSGWDTKAMLRRIVTSATYRQQSQVSPALLEKDPRNRLLARAPRYRLEAEMVRDQALAVSGLLSRKVGGPSVFPPQPEGLWQAAFNGQRTWATSAGEDRHRRALYTFWRRTVPYPSMATFDAPSREVCALRRIRTNTPLQAFVTLNDPVYVEAAQALARRLMREGGTMPEERIQHGILLCTGRPGEAAAVRLLADLYRELSAQYRERPEEARALATEPLGPLSPELDAAEAAAWTAVSNVLLNLDAALTRS